MAGRCYSHNHLPSKASLRTQVKAFCIVALFSMHYALLKRKPESFWANLALLSLIQWCRVLSYYLAPVVFYRSQDEVWEWRRWPAQSQGGGLECRANENCLNQQSASGVWVVPDTRETRILAVCAAKEALMSPRAAFGQLHKENKISTLLPPFHALRITFPG